VARIISYKIIAKDKFSAVADKISRKTNELTNQIKIMTVAAKISIGAFSGLGDQIKRLGRWMTLGTLAVGAAGTKSVVVAGQIESLRMSISGLVGSAEAGDRVMSQLFDFASSTPFSIRGLGEASRMLIATGISSEELITKLQILGDIASVSGGDVKGLALIYAQIRGRPTLAKQDVYQLLNRGIPFTQAIADYMNKEGGVTGITKEMIMEDTAKIPGEIAIKALEQLNRRGNMAYKAMELQSKTTPGLWSNIADELTQTWAIMGDIVGEFIHVKAKMQSIIDSLQGFRGWLLEFSKSHPFITGAFLTLVMFFSILGPILAMMGGVIAHILVMGAALAGLKYYTGTATVGFGAMKTVLYALKMVIGKTGMMILGWGAVILGVLAVLGIVWLYWDEISDFMIKSLFTVLMWFDKIKDRIGDVWGGVTQFFGSIFSSNESQVSVDLNLNDPGGYVDNIGLTSQGPVITSVGWALQGVR
jgi:hypothetical protein